MTPEQIMAEVKKRTQKYLDPAERTKGLLS